MKKNLLSILILCGVLFGGAPLKAQTPEPSPDQPAAQDAAPEPSANPAPESAKPFDWRERLEAPEPSDDPAPAAEPAASEPEPAPPADAAQPAASPLPDAPEPSSPPQRPAAAEPPTSEPAPAPQPAVEEPPAPKPAPPPMQEAQPQEEQGPVKLTIATWGGAYQQAQKLVLFDPFAKETSHKIEIVQHDGSLAALQNQAGRTGPEWDVADLSASVADKGCDSGLLEPLEPSLLAAAGDAADPSADFLPGAIKPCAIGSVAWSAVILYNVGAFKKRMPATLADLFDAKNFPGKRLLPKGAKYNLELALMADGVGPGEVYASLQTPEGQARALNKLNQIKDHIIWWDKPSEPVAKLAAGDAAFALGFNGRAFQAIVAGRASLGIIWDGQIYDVDFWAIPKGAKHLKAAKDFIRFATAPEQLAAETRWLPYGPVRLSALSKVGKHAEMGIDMTPYIPTRNENFKRALAMDETWWAQNEGKAAEKFNAWLEGRHYAEPAAEAATSPETGDSPSQSR